ncbi:MAG: MATE family efflux transporter, partial [Victivallales bacterium]|nr:MATE family efflux transporter [Victivallales bacterium]
MPMENNKKQLIHDFTTGPLLRHLVLFALPFMASNALQILYSIVDMMVVGHYVGKNGLAAVAVSSQTFNLMVMLCAGTSQGGQIMLSQMIGNGQRQRLGVAIGTLFTLLLGAGVVVTAIGVVFARQILHLLNTPADIFDDALSYTLVCCWGIVFAYGYNIVSAIMRGMGDSRHPFIFILIASVINVVLDLLFVACFHWGVFGAGLATILGQAFSFLYALWFLYQHRDETGFDFMPHSFRIEKQCLKGLLKLGLPLACRFSIVNFSMLFVIAMVASTGSAALGTFGAGTKLDDVANKM